MNILCPVIITLGLERLFDFLKERWNNKNDFKKIKNLVLEEIDFNCQPGVGNSQSPFKLEGHEKLLSCENLDKDTKNMLREIIYAASRCNSYGGFQQLKISSGQVKGLSKRLKQRLDLL